MRSRESAAVNPSVRQVRRRVLLASIALCFCALGMAPAGAGYHIVYSFGDGPGQYPNPESGVTFDSAGNIYGTVPTYPGEVYELMRQGARWQETTLYAFTGSSGGASPWAALAFDPAGNLYGTAGGGGGSGCYSAGCGVVFELSPGPSGWIERVLYRFEGGTNGDTPQAGLTRDSAGNLFGVTTYGGDASCGSMGCGIVFELSPGARGWTETVLHRFTGGRDGAWPYFGALALDRKGNLYGTTAGIPIGYGWNDFGTVFELSSRREGSWRFATIYRFKGRSDGAYPMAGVTLDDAGNLYGTTQSAPTYEHQNDCCGTVFELRPWSSGWMKTTLNVFTGSNGAFPAASVTLDDRGNIYGTTGGGGNGRGCAIGCGVAFELVHSSSGWSPTILHDFGSAHYDGLYPAAPLTLEHGRLYGTTVYGGRKGYGTIFAVDPR